MAMIRLIHGGTFFGHIKEYDWKGKFLVVELYKSAIGGETENTIILWENVERVFVSEEERQGEVKL